MTAIPIRKVFFNYLRTSPNVFYTRLVSASLPQKGDKMRCYFAGLEYGQYYLSESKNPVRVACGRPRVFILRHVSKLTITGAR